MHGLGRVWGQQIGLRAPKQQGGRGDLVIQVPQNLLGHHRGLLCHRPNRFPNSGVIVQRQAAIGLALEHRRRQGQPHLAGMRPETL